MSKEVKVQKELDITSRKKAQEAAAKKQEKLKRCVHKIVLKAEKGKKEVHALKKAQKEKADKENQKALELEKIQQKTESIQSPEEKAESRCNPKSLRAWINQAT